MTVIVKIIQLEVYNSREYLLTLCIHFSYTRRHFLINLSDYLTGEKREFTALLVSETETKGNRKDDIKIK